MRTIEFKPDDIKRLRTESNSHGHQIVRRRMRALLLKSEGLPHRQIGQILDISQPTLRAYFDLYVASGVEALKQLNYQGKVNLLMERKAEIIKALEAEPGHVELEDPPHHIRLFGVWDPPDPVPLRLPLTVHPPGVDVLGPITIWESATREAGLDPPP